jgi:hypothetical protein
MVPKSGNAGGNEGHSREFDDTVAEVERWDVYYMAAEVQWNNLQHRLVEGEIEGPRKSKVASNNPRYYN